MSMPTPTVFIVDDDRSVRESLKELLQSAGCRTETSASAEAFLVRPHLPAPSCLLLDLSLPGINGLALQARLAAHRSDLPIIIISGHSDVPMAVRAMKAGALSLLTKPLVGDEVLSAVREALERSHATYLREARVRELRQRYDSLSLREREVMVLVVAGLLNKQVGGRLGISEITVKAHRGRVMRKMLAQSLPDLVTMAAILRLPEEGFAAHRNLRPGRSPQFVLEGPWPQDSAGLYYAGAALA